MNSFFIHVPLFSAMDMVAMVAACMEVIRTEVTMVEGELVTRMVRLVFSSFTLKLIPHFIPHALV